VRRNGIGSIRPIAYCRHVTAPNFVGATPPVRASSCGSPMPQNWGEEDSIYGTSTACRTVPGLMPASWLRHRRLARLDVSIVGSLVFVVRVTVASVSS
jgi:hypothetical protein